MRAEKVNDGIKRKDGRERDEERKEEEEKKGLEKKIKVVILISESFVTGPVKGMGQM
jgi:hypothetical protein